ncbi:hypothetical protein AVEN_199517-1 [Araneus ventricosus]|uniref:Uncharacterized protein n=1 Tax=Araneus ventricosus TaxID=182803 RepID=A0A4Y2SK61_ARAVE|nr:hypothetical protein AVEN_199517-1 [Araneus ventricosus]
MLGYQKPGSRGTETSVPENARISKANESRDRDLSAVRVPVFTDCCRLRKCERYNWPDSERQQIPKFYLKQSSHRSREQVFNEDDSCSYDQVYSTDFA